MVPPETKSLEIPGSLVASLSKNKAMKSHQLRIFFRVTVGVLQNGIKAADLYSADQRHYLSSNQSEGELNWSGAQAPVIFWAWGWLVWSAHERHRACLVLRS